MLKLSHEHNWKQKMMTRSCVEITWLWHYNNIELLAIIKDFKTWHDYFKKTVDIILVFIDYNNLKKFMKIIYLSNK